MRRLIEMAIMIAAALILSHLRLFRMPYGGSITLTMVPLFIITLRWGLKSGIIAGAVLGLLRLAFDPAIYHPVQALLDYPLAYAAIGLGGSLRHKPRLAVAGGTFCRFICHFFAGVIFFGHYAPGWMWASFKWQWLPPVVYSLLYNLFYLIPEFIIAVVLTPLVFAKLPDNDTL